MRNFFKQIANRQTLKDQQAITTSQLQTAVKRSNDAALRVIDSVRDLLAENDRIKLHGVRRK